MAMKTTFPVRTFVVKRKRLVPGDRELAPTESGALKKPPLLPSDTTSTVPSERTSIQTGAAAVNAI